MKFSFAALTILYISTVYARLAEQVQRETQTTACYDGKNIRFSVTNADCCEDEFLEGLQAALDSKNNCDNDAASELDLLADGGSTAALANITALCANFLESLESNAPDMFELPTGKEVKRERESN